MAGTAVIILLQEHLHTVYNYSGRISLQHRYVILGKVSIDYTILEQEKEFAIAGVPSKKGVSFTF